MIRHIVAWKLKAEDAAGKATAAAEIAAALEGLAPLIPEIIAIKVHVNVADDDRNSDVAVVADYASLDDLEAYLVHPAHQAAVAVITERVVGRAAFDYEL